MTQLELFPQSHYQRKSAETLEEAVANLNRALEDLSEEFYKVANKYYQKYIILYRKIKNNVKIIKS